jgi:hypothetical protein
MISFKQYLREYLTRDQIKKIKNQYGDIDISDDARKATDHFFGKGNDVVRGVVKPSEDTDQSEVHRAVSRALHSKIGRDLTHDEYKSGKVVGLDGRTFRVGGLLPDNLKDHFANDPIRKDKDYNKGLSYSVHRGIQVFGQTNSAQHSIHPTGHAWKSCKDVDSGLMRDYLPAEVENGTLVAFHHDKDGREIGRTTLQPYRNMYGDTAYHVDSHYGSKSEDFKELAKEIARRASTPIENDPDDLEAHIFKIKKGVYNDSGVEHIINPNASKDIVDELRRDPDHRIRIAALRHDLSNSDHVLNALKDRNAEVRAAAASHPLLPDNTLTDLIEGKDKKLAMAALTNPKHTGDHLMYAIKSGDTGLALAALNSRRIRKRHITAALNHPDEEVQGKALSNENVDEKELIRGSNSPYKIARHVLANKNTPSHILDKFFERENTGENGVLLQTLLNHRNATEDHFMKAVQHSRKTVREAAIDHNKVPESVLKHASENESDRGLRALAKTKLANLIHKQQKESTF